MIDLYKPSDEMNDIPSILSMFRVVSEVISRLKSGNISDRDVPTLIVSDPYGHVRLRTVTNMSL